MAGFLEGVYFLRMVVLLKAMWIVPKSGVTDFQLNLHGMIFTRNYAEKVGLDLCTPNTCC